jgi:hypothetical protein
MRNAALITFVTACTLLVGASAAWAAGDPSKIGDNALKIVQPNVKSFWIIGLLVGVVILFITRRYNVVGPFLGLLLLAGIFIHNPGGVGQFINSVADSIL